MKTFEEWVNRNSENYIIKRYKSIKSLKTAMRHYGKRVQEFDERQLYLLVERK